MPSDRTEQRDAYFVSTIPTPSGSGEKPDAVPLSQGVADEQAGMIALGCVLGFRSLDHDKTPTCFVP